MGIGGGIIYYVSNREYQPREVVVSTFVLGFLIGIVNSFLLVLLWYFNFLGKTAETISVFQLLMIAFIMVFNSIYFFITRMARGASEFNTTNAFEITKSLMNPIVMIFFVYLLALRIDGVIYGLIILNSTLALGISWKYYKKYKPVLQFRFDFIKKSFRYGIKGWLGDMAVRANVRLDQLILGGIVSAQSLGIYSVGVTLTEMLWIISDSVGPVLFNRISSEKDLTLKMALTERINRILFSISVIISIIWISLCIYIIIPYGYGDGFKSSVIPMMILVPGALLYIPAKVTTKLLSGSGRILDTSKATAIGSGTSILLYFILIPSYGMIGAAIASSIGYCCVSICCIYYTKKHFNLSIKHLMIPNRTDYDWIKTQLRSIKKHFKK